MPPSPVAPGDVEVEWQLDALDLRPVERWLADLPALPEEPGGVLAPVLEVVARPTRRLTDTYMDTTDWRVGRSGFSLRMRQRAGHRQVTLKDMSPAAAAGLRRRVEITEALGADGLDALGDGGPVGRRLHALVGTRHLEPVIEVRTRRRPFDLRVAHESVAEIALDESVISVSDGGRPVRLRRVEVEVSPAWVETLGPLVERLRTDCGLQPATLSKFEAGLLAAGLRMPAPPDLGSTAMTPSPTVGDVAYAVLRRNVGAMLAHEPGTRLGEDVEELHDMRVATRRLRAALAMFAEALPVRAQHFRVELGWLADALGGVRDLDVQLERLAGWTAEVPEEDRASLDELAALLEGERDRARETLLAALESRRYERLVSGLTTLLRQGPSRRSGVAMTPAAIAVPGLVQARHAAAVKAARRARRSGIATDFHRLRIRGKRLRYALEFVSEVYDGQTVRYVRKVVALQDALGLMQDAQVAAARLHALATARDSTLSATTVFTMGGIAERYREESERLLRNLPDKVAVLRGPDWHKFVALMERRRAEHEAATPWPPVRRARPLPATAETPASGAAFSTSASTVLPETVPRPMTPTTGGSVTGGSVTGDGSVTGGAGTDADPGSGGDGDGDAGAAGDRSPTGGADSGAPADAGLHLRTVPGPRDSRTGS